MRVLDLSGEIAGPYATKQLVDGGADVLKVESPAGDPLRRWSASKQALGDRDGALFQYLNAGKRSVVWRLDEPADRDAFLALAADVDLVVEDLGPGRLDRLGLGFETLRRDNPRLSLLSISDWGLEGPWKDRPATEWTMASEVGSTAYRGSPDRGAVGAGGRFGEWVTGTYAGVAALAAWRAARRTGVGEHVDLSMFESLNLTMTVYHDLQGQFFEGPLAQAIEIPSIVPAKDGWVGLCTYTGQQWKDFCALIGRPDIGEDERFYDGRARMEHMDFMNEVIHAWTREQTVAEIVELATLMRIPVAPIGNGQTVLEMDHLIERGVFIENPGGFTQPRTPYQIAGVVGGPGAPPLRRAPSLGEHSKEVGAEAAQAQASARGTAHPAAPKDSPGKLPFEGIRILDLTAFWAGPIVTSTLGALGAEVLKVESVQRPDGMRFAGAVRNDRLWEFSPVFHGANANKKAITLDLGQEEGKALLLRLIEESDLVIENFSARVMENFGLPWPVLHERAPRLISVRMPAWGLDGPWRDRVGFAPSMEQASGLAWTTGYDDMPLILRGVCDPIGGMHAVVAITMALEERERTGEGVLVEVPLVEPALAVASEQVIEYTAYGHVLGRSENRGPFASPQGIFRCQPSGREERYEKAEVAIAIATDAQWSALARVMQRPEWESDASLTSEAGRRAAEERIEEGISDWCGQRDCDEVVDTLLAAGIPAAGLANAHYLSPNPQLEARAFFEELEHPAVGRLRYPGLPFRFRSRAEGWLSMPPPTLGQHNEEVLRDRLNLSEAERAALGERKITGTRPAFEI